MKKRPNGTGSVFKLPGNRKRPYAAAVVTGWKDDGKANRKYIGYYRTRAEALRALSVYDPEVGEKPTIKSFADVYSLYKAEAFETLKPNTQENYELAYSRMKEIHNTNLDNLTLGRMQEVVSPMTASGGKFAKIVLKNVLQYAIRHEMIEPGRDSLVQYVQTSNRQNYTITRKVFTKEEIQTAPHWLQVMIYTGLRVGEFSALTDKDIDKEKRCITISKSKTSAGIRKVPIPKCVLDYVEPPRMSVRYIQKQVALYNHTPHDTRHTFVSMMADAGIDERITKACVGHAGSGITETVYTHLDFGTLLAAVDKLPDYVSNRVSNNS